MHQAYRRTMQFIKLAKYQNKYCGIHSGNQNPSGNGMSFSYNKSAKVKSLNRRIVKSSGFSSSNQLAFRPISQETSRKWEKSARESTYICNQAADFIRCLTRVQDDMLTQLQIIQSYKAKGKSLVRS